MVHPDQMIRPFPRYHELYKKRGLGVDPAAAARKRFSKKDLIDLQCWSNLVWIHPLAFEQDAELAEFRQKGRGWTEQEKQWLLDKQMELLRQVVPLHRELMERGQVELTTTPFYHPILPLLWDKRLARRAMPNVALPKHLESYPDDARQQVRQAVEFHQRLFGQKPRGMWPSEGSVCQGIVPVLAEAGVQWIGTDEEILSCSTDGWVSRDHNGYLRNPEMLYRPWRVEEQGKSLQIVFRDHAMSDQIGFHYYRYAPEHAVGDFIGKLEAIGNATGGNAGHRPTLVSIILDGENCWEYYPNAGVEFLRGLYRRVVQHAKIKPVRDRRVSRPLARRRQARPALSRQLDPAQFRHLDRAPRVQSGLGPVARNAAASWPRVRRRNRSRPRRSASRRWKELYDRRRERLVLVVRRQPQQRPVGPVRPALPQALAERLPGVGRAAADGACPAHPPRRPPRPALHRADGPAADQGGRAAELLRVDQRRALRLRRLAGAMSMVTQGCVSDLYFGFDAERLFLRLDARGGPFREQLAEVEALRVVFVQPEGLELSVAHPSRKEPKVQLRRHGAVMAGRTPWPRPT